MKDKQKNTSNSFNISEITIKKPVSTILIMMTMY